MTSAASTPAVEMLDLASLNAAMDASEPRKIVAWAAVQFGQDLVMTSSFGAESALLLHMATRELPRIRIIMIDTGYLFPETWQHMEALRRRLDLNVWVYRTRNDPIAYLRKAGEFDPTERRDTDACCAANKIEPMQRAIAELSPRAWLRGIRRDQTADRESKQIVEWDARDQCYAVSPVLNWNRRQIHAYMKQHDLPYHPLFDKGFASIGCNPLSCTRPIQIGEDPRAGRWAGSEKVECGINLTNAAEI